MFLTGFDSTGRRLSENDRGGERIQRRRPSSPAAVPVQIGSPSSAIQQPLADVIWCGLGLLFWWRRVMLLINSELCNTSLILRKYNSEESTEKQ